MSPARQRRFDLLVQQVIADLPEPIRRVVDEVPVIVLDRPTPQMLADLGLDPADVEAADELCGLHTGTALTERSVELPVELPTEVHLFREGIVRLAGGWDSPDAEQAIREEIRITLLHELGHHFGLDEQDLADLGYE